MHILRAVWLLPVIALCSCSAGPRTVDEFRQSAPKTFGIAIDSFITSKSADFVLGQYDLAGQKCFTGKKTTFFVYRVGAYGPQYAGEVADYKYEIVRKGNGGSFQVQKRYPGPAIGVDMDKFAYYMVADLAPIEGGTKVSYSVPGAFPFSPYVDLLKAWAEGGEIKCLQ